MPQIQVLDTMVVESSKAVSKGSAKRSTQVSEVHSLNRLPAMLVNLSAAASVVSDDPDLQKAEMNIRRSMQGTLAMSNMKRRQKLHLEETVGRMSNLDREIKGLKVQTEVHKLKESAKLQSGNYRLPKGSHMNAGVNLRRQQESDYVQMVLQLDAKILQQANESSLERRNRTTFMTHSRSQASRKQGSMKSLALSNCPSTIKHSNANLNASVQRQALSRRERVSRMYQEYLEQHRQSNKSLLTSNETKSPSNQK